MLFRLVAMREALCHVPLMSALKLRFIAWIEYGGEWAVVVFGSIRHSAFEHYLAQRFE